MCKRDIIKSFYADLNPWVSGFNYVIFLVLNHF